MRISRLVRFVIGIVAIVLLLLIVNQLFFTNSEQTNPLPSDVDWSLYNTPTAAPATTAAPDTSGASVTASPIPTPTYAGIPGMPDTTASGGFTVPGTTQSGASPTATGTATPKPTATPTSKPTATPKPTATSSSSALRNGDEGSAVKAVQQRLKDLGYLTGSVDGVFGDATEAAVKAFQSASGLTADGVVGSQTLSKLNSSSAKSKSTEVLAKATAKPTPKSYTPSEPSTYRYLQLGSSGSDVTRLQNRLIELGYLSGSASGYFDEATRVAVWAFQERNGQWVDGVAGEDTQTALYKSDALPAKK